MVLVVCTWSDDALYFYEVSWKYLERFSSYRADLKWPLSNFKVEQIKNVLTKVMVLLVCRSSDNALYFYEVSWKSLERLSGDTADTILWQTDRQTDRDGQTTKAKIICLRSFHNNKDNNKNNKNNNKEQKTSDSIWLSWFIWNNV